MCSASSGCARPETSTRRFDPVVSIPDMWSVLSTRAEPVRSVFVGAGCLCGGLGRLGCRGAGSMLLDPSLDVALRGHVHGECARGNVLADDGAGAGVRPIGNPN